MPDMEKVIALLDDMRLLADMRVHEIVSPDNWSVYADLCDLIDLAKESALALLREQEPARVTTRRIPAFGGSIVWTCGKCGADLAPNNAKAKYCSNCGQAVRWDADD